MSTSSGELDVSGVNEHGVLRDLVEVSLEEAPLFGRCLPLRFLPFEVGAAGGFPPEPEPLE